MDRTHSTATRKVHLRILCRQHFVCFTCTEETNYEKEKTTKDNKVKVVMIIIASLSWTWALIRLIEALN